MLEEILQSIIVYEGITTGISNTGNSFIDSNLAGRWEKSYVGFIAQLYPGESAKVDVKIISGFNVNTGEITVSHSFRDGQIPAGVKYRILLPSLLELDAKQKIDAIPNIIPAILAAISRIPTSTSTSASTFGDTVYFDSTDGSAGTASPIGMANKPVSNLPDAIAIMAANKISKLQLVGKTGSITFDSPIRLELIGNAGYSIVVTDVVTLDGNLVCASLFNTGTLVTQGIVCGGDVENNANMTMHGNCYVAGAIKNLVGNPVIYGDVYCAGEINDSSGGNLTINGNIYNKLGIVRDGAGTTTISGNVYSENGITIGTGKVIVTGNLQTSMLGSVIINTGAADIGSCLVGSISNDAGIIDIRSDCRITYDDIYNSNGGSVNIRGNLFMNTGISNDGAASSIAVSGRVDTGSVTNKGSMTLGSLLCRGIIDNTGAVNILILGDCVSYANVINTSGLLSIGGNLTINTDGIENDTGNIIISKDCFLHNGGTTNHGTGSINIGGNCICIDSDIVNDTAGLIAISGNCHTHNISNPSTGTINIIGNAQVDQAIANSGILNLNSLNCLGSIDGASIDNSATGVITVNGDCNILYDIGNAGVMNISGILKCSGVINNNGFLTYKGTYNDIAINTYAILANEIIILPAFVDYLMVHIEGTIAAGPFTIGEIVEGGLSGLVGQVINQTAGSIDILVTNTQHPVPGEVITGDSSAASISTLTASYNTTYTGANYHYTIDSLILKCADPGADTVNVKLYMLVNGILTNIKTFPITQAGTNPFTNYYTLSQMFGMESLSGDNIKITVQTDGGGPYAITGSYKYRSM